MSAYFLDSSALVKRYAQEQGTAFIITLLKPSAKNQIYVARTAFVEVISALARRHRGGSLRATQWAKANARFRRLFKRQFRILEIDESVADESAQLAEKHFLRGYDAIQLATALEVQRIRTRLGAAPLIFVSADNELNNAAHAEGLAVENPNHHP